MRVSDLVDSRTILRSRRRWLYFGVFWLGAIATGLVAVVYARLVDFGYSLFVQMTGHNRWLPL
ncbi:chloride channel protein, partial [Paraburkholderia sp. BR10937]